MNVWCSGALLRLQKGSLLAFVVVSLGGLVPPTAAFAHKFEAETVMVDHPYAFPTPPGVKTGGVYFDAITAVGDATDRLVSASSSAAARVEIHRMHMDGDIMRMREVGEVSISQSDPVAFHKGAHDGHHLMLMELTAPLTAGSTVPVTLRFEKAGDVEVEVKVVPFGSHPKAGKTDQMDHSKHK